MTVRLRPGVHHAPVENGVMFIGHRSSFVLSGPPVLAALVDRCVPLLAEGTTVEALAAGVGAKEAVVERIVQSLVARRLILDLASLTEPEPDVAERHRFDEAITSLEVRHDDPYAAWRRLRSATVGVRGTGPAAAAARRGLERLGVAVNDDAGTEADLTLVLHADPALPQLHPEIHVMRRGGVVLASSVLDAGTDHAGWHRRAETAVVWAETRGDHPSTEPLASVLATGLCVRTAFDWLASGATGAGWVIHGGPSLRADPLAAPSWERPSPPDDPIPSAVEHLARRGAALTQPWIGHAELRRTPSLPQLPIPQVVIDGRSPDWTGTAVGVGATQAAATVDAHLSALRAIRRGEGIIGAGHSEAAARADLGLRGHEPGPATVPVAVEQLDREVRRLLRALVEYEGVAVSLRAFDGPRPAGWVAIGVFDTGGQRIAAEWGPGEDGAAGAALASAISRVQCDAAGVGATDQSVVGTTSILGASDDALLLLGAATGTAASGTERIAEAYWLAR